MEMVIPPLSIRGRLREDGTIDQCPRADYRLLRGFRPAGKVLRHRDSQVEVEDDMPPPARHHHGLPGALEALHWFPLLFPLRASRFLLYPRIDERKPSSSTQ